MTIPELLDAWAGAEVAGDPTQLAPLLDDDFTAIGPLGFILTRDVRATIVLARGAGRWRMVRVHMSFIAGTVGAPPVPGRAGRQQR